MLAPDEGKALGLIDEVVPAHKLQVCRAGGFTLSADCHAQMSCQTPRASDLGLQRLIVALRNNPRAGCMNCLGDCQTWRAGGGRGGDAGDAQAPRFQPGGACGSVAVFMV